MVELVGGELVVMKDECDDEKLARILGEKGVMDERSAMDGGGTK